MHAQAHLNREQLNKQFIDLFDFYKRAHAQGVPTPNSPEFK